MGTQENIDCLMNLYLWFSEGFLEVEPRLKLSRAGHIRSSLCSVERVLDYLTGKGDYFPRSPGALDRKKESIDIGLILLADAERVLNLPSSRFDYQE